MGDCRVKGAAGEGKGRAGGGSSQHPAIRVLGCPGGGCRDSDKCHGIATRAATAQSSQAVSRSQLPCWIHTQRNPGSLYIILATCRIHRKKLLPAHFCSLKSKTLLVFFFQGRQSRELEILAGCERDATLSSSCREKNARCERVTPTVVLEGNLPAWRDGESKARHWKSAAGRCETGAEVTGCCRRGRELSGVWPGGKGCKGLVWRGICFCFKTFGNVLETGTRMARFLLSPPRDQEAAGCPCPQAATGRSRRR